MTVNRWPGEEDDTEKLRCIAALNPAEQVAMAKWALKGYQFVFFPGNSSNRQWKALDMTKHHHHEVHTAETLYVLLCALGEPK